MCPQPFTSYLLPILLLVGSNIFMTTAWYWHLRSEEIPLFRVILISWALAFVELPWRFRPIGLAARFIPPRNSRRCRR